MATVKRTATIMGYFLELGAKDIEIYSIAQDGSGTLKRIDDIQGTIRAISEKVNFERDYNLSFRQHVAKLIQYVNKQENNDIT